MCENLVSQFMEGLKEVVPLLPEHVKIFAPVLQLPDCEGVPVVPVPPEPVDPPPGPSEHLLIKEDQRAPVWPKINGQVSIGDLRAGDTVKVLDAVMMGDQPWYEVYIGNFDRFDVDVGWVKYKEDKMELVLR